MHSLEITEAFVVSRDYLVFHLLNIRVTNYIKSVKIFGEFLVALSVVACGF